MPDKPNQQGRQTTFRESDGCIVPTPAEDQSAREKPGNTGAGKSARPTRDSDRTPAVRSDGTTVLTRLDRIHQRAESQPEAVFDNLFSLLNLSLLRRAFRRLKQGKAPGVDGVTLEDYEEHLWENLHSLLERLHGIGKVLRRDRHFASNRQIERIDGCRQCERYQRCFTLAGSHSYVRASFGCAGLYFGRSDIMLSTMNATLKCLFDADQRDHAASHSVGTPEYDAMRSRDRDRRASVRAILRLGPTLLPIDLYHAAWILNHGDCVADAKLACEIAADSYNAGHRPARWLYAAAYDRSCMYQGQPQKFGTQIVPDGERFRVWHTDEGTTDQERSQFDVPALSELHERAAKQTTVLDQPALDNAPEWLLDGIQQWKVSEQADDSA